MFSRFERLLIALMIALLLAGVSLILASAQVSLPGEVQQTPECGTCHPQFLEAWLSGPHGNATIDPAFEAAWTEQGKPGACLVCHTTGYDPATGTWAKDGVACEACHSPVPAGHPKEPMPVEKSPELCGHCHAGAHFDWQDWEASAHYQRNMSCLVCHDPHIAGIRVVPSEEEESLFAQGDKASALCLNCHHEEAMDFPYSVHHEAGLTCVDCHLGREGGDRQTHSVPDHSFNASLTTCNACHAEQMHGPIGPSAPSSRTSNPYSAPSDLQRSGLTPEPKPVSPIGFSILAGLIGLAAGVILAPWLEKLYQTIHVMSSEENDG